MTKVYKVHSYNQYDAKGLIQNGYRFEQVFNMPEADIVVMPGGGDWNTILYANYVHPKVYEAPKSTDIAQLTYLKSALKQGKFVLGICRGAQGLCIAAGGGLIQDVNHHGGQNHDIYTKNGMLVTNSLHHQMLDLRKIPKDDYILYAYAYRATLFEDKSVHNSPFDTREPEIVYFKNMRALAVQGHPEMPGMPIITNKYIQQLIDYHYFDSVRHKDVQPIINRIDQLLRLLEKPPVMVELFPNFKEDILDKYAGKSKKERKRIKNKLLFDYDDDVWDSWGRDSKLTTVKKKEDTTSLPLNKISEPVSE